MSGRRVLSYTLRALGGLIALLVFLLFVVDFGFLKPKLEQVVSSATGREFRIAGDLHLKLLPRPSLQLADVSLSSPDWGTQAHMLQADNASLEVGFWSLLAQPIIIRDFTLEGVNVLVETNTSEALNWNIAKATDESDPVTQNLPPSAEPTEQSLPLKILSANLNNIQIIYRKTAADDFTFALNNLDIRAQDDHLTTLNADATLAQLPLTLAGEVTAVRSDLKLKIGEVDINSQYDYADSDVAFKTSVSSLNALGQLLSLDNLPTENLTLGGSIAIDGNKIHLSNITAALSDMQLILNGVLDTAEASANLTTSYSGDKLSTLAADLPAIPFTLAADIFATSEAASINTFSAKFGDSELTGDAKVTLTEVPALKINLNAKLVDLEPFEPAAKDASATKEASPKEKAPPQRYVFEETPLPIDVLNTFNLDINASIDRLVTRTGELNNVLLALELKDGQLTLHNQLSNKHGGELTSNLLFDASQAKNELTLNTQVHNFKIMSLSGEGVPDEDVPATNLNLALRAKGGSPRALASSLDGKILLRQGPGKVNNNLIESFSGDIVAQLIGALNPFANKEPLTVWDCGIVGIDFSSGKGDITGFLLQTEKLMIVGGGGIDLNTEELNFEFNTKPRKGVGVSADMFVTPFVELNGTLAQPGVGLNKKGLLLTGGAAILTGGMSFLYKGIIDRATAEGSQCNKVLEAIAERSAAEPAN